MPNTYVNKVVLGSETLLDLTSDTVTPSALMQGYTAHDASGSPIVGTATGGGAEAGTVYQDAEGYIVLDDGAPSGSVTVEALSVTANGTYTAPTGHAYSPVTVAVPSGGGGDSGDRSDPIRFFDYDGTLVASYKAVPSALPDVPTHALLTNGTWNRTLAQVASQFAAMGTCDVGANYDTASGRNEIDVTLDSDHLEPWLCIAVSGTATVDWGDGSSTDTLTGTSFTTLRYLQHAYAQAGEYTISIDGAVGFYSSSNAHPAVLRSTDDTSTNRLYNRAYCECVTAVRVADGSRIGTSAFSSCYSLTSVSIPDGVTSIGTSAFYSCYSLTSVSIPDGVTSIGTSAFSSCYSTYEYHMLPTTPPTLASTSAFSGIVADTKIYVPTGSLEAYQTATNWSTYASYMEEE